ncbi:polysaccharide deacetylase family protein [uncultured Microbulbifer sp.]|uniref:polysaccharide deacetylase family protein n=1 Tax=uncultured Microbulbifer sp. TaxID=348147 RepID=UPI0025FB5C89|nr:polysaccharide deacetylase family protein [uncultured Microbulbifer sp.]
MRVLLTFDYELFFGRQTGTPQACMIHACDRLLQVLDAYAAKAVFFVDASYLVRLRDYSGRSVRLERDYADVIDHVRWLESCGHQIQLHVHPHWFDSSYDGHSWNMVTDRYRLTQWSSQEITKLVSRCAQELNAHLKHKAFVFRAGGWCVQPFSPIARALLSNGITADSSVYHGGQAASATHQFDFRSAPQHASWQFNTDPCQPDRQGAFTELAISSLRVSPFFYWRFALSRLFGAKHRHRSFGDGRAIENGHSHLLHLLTHYSHMAVSVDGYKSTLLRHAYQQAQRKHLSHFVAMGHPKSLTPCSLENLRAWLGDIYASGGQLEGYQRSRQPVLKSEPVDA